MSAAMHGDKVDVPLEPQVAEAAGEWFARLSADAVGEKERHAWQQWRAEHPEHERAWQRVESVGRSFGILLPDAGMAALDRRPASPSRRQAFKSIVLVATVGGAGWMGYRQAAWRDATADYRTAKGERRDVVLADGTRMVLNTGSAVDVRFNARERRIDLLHGEIHLASAHDPQRRPLIVDTRFGRLQPLGTRFTVQQDDAFVRLTVFDGAVQAQPFGGADVSQTPCVVPAGGTVRLDAQGMGDNAPAREGADAWTQGLLLADGMSLGEWVAELARYRVGWLQCDPAVSGLRLSGAFPLDDTDRALAAVTRALPVRVDRFSRFWVTLRPT